MSNSKRALFIDGQVFQSAAWDRGMGKYSLALLKALMNLNNYGYDETAIVFTKNMPLENEAKKLIKDAAPKAKHIFADLNVPFDPCLEDIPKLQKLNEAILQDVVSENTTLDPSEVDYFILSLFIDQVCSVFPQNCNKILLVYDLIPLQYNERYSKLCTFPSHLARYKTLFEADKILTISQTVADDVAIYLGISPSKISNIDGAPIERSSTGSVKPKFNIPKNFVLMPSGNDLRKNNQRAVQAFEEYRRDSGNSDIQLLITSHFDTKTIQTLNRYSTNITFTGNVTESELQWLYEKSDVVLFVPEYEGLGLPILEAAEVNKPIVCSNLSVFNEMSSTAFYYSDPLDSLSIVEALNAAMSKIEFDKKQSEYKSILDRYTWPTTASKAYTALQTDNPTVRKDIAKPKLAIFSPSPSGYSDIGKRVMQLHPAMSGYFDIDYYLEEGKTKNSFTRPNYLPYVANVFAAQKFTTNKYNDYDAVLYHLGNSEFHLETIKNALYLPGYAVFHDTHLNNIFEGELKTYGYVSEARLDAEKTIDKLIDNTKTSCVTSLANNQLGIVVHSEFARKALQHLLFNNVPIAKANLPVAVPKQLKSKLQENRLTIGFAGIIHPAKGLDIIEAIAKKEEFYECDIRIFGLSLVPDEVIKRLESYPNVTVNTNVTDFQFQNILSSVDVLVNFRKDYRGETSAATLEAMRFGAIPIVRKIGWYDELPDRYVKKAQKIEDVTKFLQELLDDTEALRKVTKESREYLEQNFSYEAYAKEVHEAITQNRVESVNTAVGEALKQGASKTKILKILREAK